jgi:hypothetical protein
VPDLRGVLKPPEPMPRNAPAFSRLCAVRLVLAEISIYRFYRNITRSFIVYMYQELSLAKDSRRNSSTNDAEKVLFFGKD